MNATMSEGLAEIKAAARARGETITTLAEKTGASSGHLSMIWRGLRPLTPRMRDRLMGALVPEAAQPEVIPDLVVPEGPATSTAGIPPEDDEDDDEDDDEEDEDDELDFGDDE